MAASSDGLEEAVTLSGVPTALTVLVADFEDSEAGDGKKSVEGEELGDLEVEPVDSSLWEEEGKGEEDDDEVAEGDIVAERDLVIEGLMDDGREGETELLEGFVVKEPFVLVVTEQFRDWEGLSDGEIDGKVGPVVEAKGVFDEEVVKGGEELLEADGNGEFVGLSVPEFVAVRLVVWEGVLVLETVADSEAEAVADALSVTLLEDVSEGLCDFEPLEDGETDFEAEILSWNDIEALFDWVEETEAVLVTEKDSLALFDWLLDDEAETELVFVVDIEIDAVVVEEREGETETDFEGEEESAEEGEFEEETEMVLVAEPEVVLLAVAVSEWLFVVEGVSEELEVFVAVGVREGVQEEVLVAVPDLDAVLEPLILMESDLEDEALGVVDRDGEMLCEIDGEAVILEEEEGDEVWEGVPEGVPEDVFDRELLGVWVGDRLGEAELEGESDLDFVIVAVGDVNGMLVASEITNRNQ